MDGASPTAASHNGAHFFDVLDSLLECLRHIHVSNKQEEYKTQWPDDLRLQAHRNCDAPTHGEWLDHNDLEHNHDTRIIVLSILQTLNSLNKFSNACAKRVLGYSIALGQAWWSFEYYAGDFGLLDDFTNVLTLEGFAVNQLPLCRDQFSLALARTAGSIRILQVRYTGIAWSSVETSVRVARRCAPGLEELNITFNRNSPLGLLNQIFQSEPILEFTSLRVIRLDYCAVKPENLLKVDHGLPPALSFLHNVNSLTAIHLYHPYPYAHFHGADFSLSVRKLTWTRKLGEEFALDSAWIRAEQKYNSEVVPGAASQLLKRVPNLTLEASFQYAAAAASVVFPIWSSLVSLTILTDDFPAGFTQHIPSSLDLLIIRFKAHCCRSTPSYLDSEVLGVLRARATKNVHICISTTKTELHDETVFDHASTSFMKPDSELFINSRTLCLERGGELILDNLLGVPEPISDTNVEENRTKVLINANLALHPRIRSNRFSR